MKQSIVLSELERHQTGVRGRKIYLMLGFLFLPFFLCLVNLVIMLVLYTILDINYKGMSSMSFFKNPQYVKWILDADLENVVLHDSTVRGFSDRSLEFRGDNQSINLSVKKLLKSSLSVTPKGTYIQAEDVKFVNPETKKTILDLTSGRRMPVIGEFHGDSLVANGVQTPRIVSHDGENLDISSTQRMNITGNEGVFADSKFIDLSAGKDIFLTVRDDKYTLTFDGRGGGVRINPDNFPNSKAATANPQSGSATHDAAVDRYRLCVCLKTGELFRARITDERITCAISMESPC